MRRLWTIWACAALASCDIYDDMSQMPDNAFTYIDATSYTQWIYLNLDNGTYVALDYNDEENIPDDWIFALHRYDCKTNGGAALETNYTSVETMAEAVRNGSYHIAEDAFVEDAEDSITIDMSHMMDGWLVYAPAQVNKELGKWLDVDISVMPPIYTPSGRVYLLRTRGREYAAVRFTGFSNPFYYDTKGYISFDYIYPLDLPQ